VNIRQMRVAVKMPLLTLNEQQLLSIAEIRCFWYSGWSSWKIFGNS